MLDFLGIGAQKAGTTWLYEMLRLHPDISFPAGKEIHFWDQRYARGIDWYRALFEGPEQEGKHCGEITPAYAILGPEFIKECYANFPDVKLIFIIRNPVERAWSSAKMALKRAEMEIHEASEQWFIDHFLSQGSMMRGDYERCLTTWLSFYPENQLLVCFYDDLQTNPTALLRRCFEHIGVDARDYNWAEDLKNKIFSTAVYSLPDRLRGALHKVYSTKIDRLEFFLGQNLSSWR